MYVSYAFIALALFAVILVWTTVVATVVFVRKDVTA